jgi:hypothetical protein
MKKFFITGLLASITSFLCAQNIDAIINPGEAERILKVLASDEMRGRRIFTPEIDKAADFIASEFKAIGLRTFDASEGYRQEFTMVRPKLVSANATLDGKTIDAAQMVVVTCLPEWQMDQSSEYDTATIRPGANLGRTAAAIRQYKKNMLVMVDESYAANLQRLVKRTTFKTDKSIVFIIGNKFPANFSITAKHEITEQKLANVVGVLPGKSKRDEYVVFSGHYDHIGVGKPIDGDSIFNGANDDAAGTTAVILLAKYFKEAKENERTLVFVAFTAEESGGYGSQYFSRQLDADKVTAMFNIEMIGTESKWGKNSAYITGYERTDMGSILQKNLDGTPFTFYPDPYPQQQLFYRSDNATLARLGVPAHTISTSKMDSEPNYHKISDEVETLDMNNMALVIKSIALSAKTIVSGKETPSRVKIEELR